MRAHFWIYVVALAVAGCGGSHGVEDAGTDGSAERDAGASECEIAGDGAPCDDGDPCTEDDVCAGGTCAGAPMMCDDGNPCTTDACSDGECVATPVDGASCDDGDACTEGDVCAGGSCGGAALDCSHLDAVCEAGSCDEGGCVATPLSGIACDTGSLCSWDLCDAGTCATGTITDCGPIGGGGTREAQETAFHGGTGGTPFVDDCPPGQLPIGVEASIGYGFYEDILHQFVTRCGALEVDGGALTITPAARVPAEIVRGDSTFGDAAPPIACPDGHVLAGFSGSTTADVFETDLVTQLTLRCAPLTLEGSAEAGYTLSVGAIVAGPTIGTREDTAIPETDCPAGMVARGTFGRAGDVLDRFGLRCGTPALRVATTAPPAGTSSGAAIDDDCPAGQVPVGVTASVAEGDRAGALTEYAMQCAAITLMEEDGGWTVTLTPGADLPEGDGHGTWEMFGAATTASCPEGEVVVGASGRASAHLEQLTLRCAASIVTGEPASGLAVGYGASAEGPSVGTETSGSAFGPHDCPEGTLASGFRVYAGEVLDGIALRCASVSAPVVDTTGP